MSVSVIESLFAGTPEIPREPEQDEWFEEWPVTLDVFIQDSSYLANPRLSDIQYEAVRHAERIYYPWTYDYLADKHPDDEARKYWSEPVRMVNFLTMEWGKGSGKDHVSRIAVLRVCYLLLVLRSPQRYYDMPPQDSIHVLNVASSSKQASRAFFTPMRRVILRAGNWFQSYGGVEVQERGPGGKRPPPSKDSAVALLDTIRFPKNIEAISGHSDAESQEGLNLIMGVADEIDAFKSQAELDKTQGKRARESSSTAEAILAMLQTSASTRFPEVFKNIRISYPRYLGSTIQKLIKEGEEDIEENRDESRYYVSGPFCTWEVNPRVKGRDDFKDAYKKDPLLARAKFECRPTYAVNPYFANEIALRECQRKGATLEVEYVREGLAWKPVYHFPEDLYPVQGAQYAMHADLAVNGDRAGVALAHVQSWQDISVQAQTEEGLEIYLQESRPVVKVDFVFGYEADTSRNPPLEIQIRWAGELCLELRRRGFIITRFSCDGYQSTDLLQRMEANGVETDRVSTDKDVTLWQAVRDLAYEGRLSLPHVELAIIELLGLSRMANGKIDHPADGSKDLADGIAGAVDGALKAGGREDEEGRRAFPGTPGVIGGYADKSMTPIGMPSMAHLVSEDPIPEDVKDMEMEGLFPASYSEDYSLVPERLM